MTRKELEKAVVEKLDEIADLALEYVNDHGIKLGERQISMAIHPTKRWLNAWLCDKEDEYVFDTFRHEEEK